MTNAEKMELLERENEQLTTDLVNERQRVSELELSNARLITQYRKALGRCGALQKKINKLESQLEAATAEQHNISNVTCTSVDGYSVNYDRESGKVVAQ